MPSGPSRLLLAADTREHGGVLKEHGYVTDRGWSGRGAAGAGRGRGRGGGRAGAGHPRPGAAQPPLLHSMLALF